MVRGVSAAGFAVGVLPDATGRAVDAAGSGPVVWLAATRRPDWLPAEIAACLVDFSTSVEVEVLHASYDVPGARCSTWSP